MGGMAHPLGTSANGTGTGHVKGDTQGTSSGRKTSEASISGICDTSGEEI